MGRPKKELQGHLLVHESNDRSKRDSIYRAKGIEKFYLQASIPLRVENKIGFAIASEDFTVLP